MKSNDQEKSLSVLSLRADLPAKTVEALNGIVQETVVE